jgi:hypothetical protein
MEDRLHAIWFVPFGYSQLQVHKALFSRYCIPMDNDRPELDIRYFKDICPNKDGTSSCNFRNWD